MDQPISDDSRSERMPSTSFNSSIGDLNEPKLECIVFPSAPKADTVDAST